MPRHLERSNARPGAGKDGQPRSRTGRGGRPSHAVTPGRLTDDLAPDFQDATFQRHAAILSDSRMAQPVQRQARAAFVEQLQRDYGNAYVQRLLSHVESSKAATVRRVGPARGGATAAADRQSFVRVLQNAGEVVYFFNDMGRHVKETAQGRLKLLEAQSRLVADPKDIAMSAQLANAIINYIEATDHNQAMSFLQKLLDLVNKGVATLDKKDAASLNWIPKQVKKVEPTPDVLASLQKPAPQQAAPAPAQQAQGGEESEESPYNNLYGVETPVETEEESPYNNLYGVETPVETEGESPYGVPIPIEAEEEESPYNA